ncbi:MAG: hypothetical protein U1F11_13605 [Steroidobacteraceae bacterium]
MAALLFLVPLVLAIYYLGRWHDLQHTTITAARYGALAAFISGRDDDPQRIAAVVARRLYGDGASRYSTSQLAQPSAWGDRADRRMLGSATSLVLPGDQGPLGVEAQPPPEDADRVARWALGMVAPTARLGGGHFDLVSDSAIRATAVVPLRAVLAVAPEAGPLLLREQLQLLVGSWSARDHLHVASRVSAFVPSTRLSESVVSLRPLQWAIELLEPSFADFCPGRLDVDIVPPDRLEGARTAPTDLRRVRC